MSDQMAYLEARCLEVIRHCRGKDRPVSQEALARAVGEEPRKVRRAVERLVKVHHEPICSSYDHHRPGYYWPVNRDEIQETYERLMRHAVRIMKRASSIMKAAPEAVMGQVQMFWDEDRKQ
jgi:hypothetical protein